MYGLKEANHQGHKRYFWEKNNCNTVRRENRSIGVNVAPLSSDSVKFIEPWQDSYKQKYTGYYLKGRWVRIKFQGVYGFVFDGYLSHFPAPKRDELQGHEYLPEYLERVFGLIDQYTRSGDNYVIREKYYGQGISFKNIGTQNAYIKYVFPNLSIQEVLIFIKNSNMASDEDRPMLLEVRKKQKYANA